MRTRWCCLRIAAFLCVGGIEAADHNIEPILSRIERQPVASSALTAVGYSKKLRAVEIEFHDGRVYRYEGVPIGVYRELISAASKARYYNQNVRGKYHCLRVRPPRLPKDSAQQTQRPGGSLT
jgi:hypothetical protein